MSERQQGQGGGQNPWQEAQERFLQTVRESQEAIAEAMGTWTHSATQMGPEAATGMPVQDMYARVEQTVEGMFDFFQQLLNQNREFTRNLLQATRPLAETPQRAAEETAQRGQETAQRQESAR